MREHIIPRTPSAYDYPLLVGHLLSTLEACHPNQEIVYADYCRLTYRQFQQRVNRLANALAALGTGAGDTVAMLDWDSHRYLECFFAVPMIGAVLHTVNIRLSPEQVLYTMNHAADDVVLVHKDFIPLVKPLAERLPTVRRWVLLAEDLAEEEAPTATGIDFVGGYETLLATASPARQLEDFDENTRATTFYTTGTTGNPKGVYFSQRQLVVHTLALAAAAASPAEQGRFHAGDVYMPITPMFHVHAWGFPYVATLLGVKQVYPGRYEPGRLLRLIADEGVTFSHCVPTILHMLLSDTLASEVDLSRWKVVIGGSALPEALAQRALDLGIDIFGGYGMSETCPVLTLAQLRPTDDERSAEELLARRCKAGRPVPLVGLRVVDTDGCDQPRDGDSSGEVVVRAPWLTQGYLDDPELSEALWQDGYLHTGDIGHVDENGYLKVTDRLKDVIKSGGEWISSLQLEDLALAHPKVSEAAAIGIADERWGERPLVLVVANSKGLDLARVVALFEQAAARGEIASWAVPERIELVDAIPKTSVGKIDKKALRGQYGGNSA